MILNVIPVIRPMCFAPHLLWLFCDFDGGTLPYAVEHSDLSEGIQGLHQELLDVSFYGSINGGLLGDDIIVLKVG